MDSRSFAIITLVFAFVVLHSGEAVKCYNCTSEQDNKCNPVTCVKYCFSCSLRSNKGSTAFIRTCDTLLNDIINQKMKLGEIWSEEIESGKCEICSKDYCNVASTNALAMGLLALLWAIRSIFT